MADEIFGFIGLGNMGGPMARHAAASGRETVVHDIAGADGAPCPTILRAYDTAAAFADSDPAQDMIRIYPFVRDGAS